MTTATTTGLSHRVTMLNLRYNNIGRPLKPYEQTFKMTEEACCPRGFSHIALLVAAVLALELGYL